MQPFFKLHQNNLPSILHKKATKNFQIVNFFGSLQPKKSTKFQSGEKPFQVFARNIFWGEYHEAKWGRNFFTFRPKSVFSREKHEVNT